MGSVIGLGGVFFRSKDPDAMREWYGKHLNIPMQPFGASFQPKAVPKGGYHLWSPFKQSTDYFGTSGQEMMINLMVENLDACLAQVKAGRATEVSGPDDTEYGRFGWFVDPEGRKVELWEPTSALPDDVK